VQDFFKKNFEIDIEKTIDTLADVFDSVDPYLQKPNSSNGYTGHLSLQFQHLKKLCFMMLCTKWGKNLDVIHDQFKKDGAFLNIKSRMARTNENIIFAAMDVYCHTALKCLTETNDINASIKVRDTSESMKLLYADLLGLFSWVNVRVDWQKGDKESRLFRGIQSFMETIGGLERDHFHKSLDCIAAQNQKHLVKSFHSVFFKSDSLVYFIMRHVNHGDVRNYDVHQDIDKLTQLSEQQIAKASQMRDDCLYAFVEESLRDKEHTKLFSALVFRIFKHRNHKNPFFEINKFLSNYQTNPACTDIQKQTIKQLFDNLGTYLNEKGFDAVSQSIALFQSNLDTQNSQIPIHQTNPASANVQKQTAKQLFHNLNIYLEENGFEGVSSQLSAIFQSESL
jgi:hypothetical protein